MQTQSKKMHGARGEENRPRNGSEEAALTLKTWWLIGPFHLCQTFSSCSIFASVFWFFSFLCVFVTLSPWFLHFLLPCSAYVICRKMKAKTEKAVPAWLWFLFLFSFFLLFLLLLLFYCLPSWSPNNARMKERNSLVLCFFLSYSLPLLCFFLSFFSYFFLYSSFPFIFFPRSVKSSQ